jgi:NADPH:quinone reductase-like Zn-dependent oxidoreductase
MKAIVQRGYGGVDVLDFRDVDRPRIGPDEVLIRVRAAGVDRGTWHLTTGLPYLVRLVYGLRGPRNPVPGLDVAGVVEEVGDQVTRFALGDEVFGIAAGSFAEYARAREDKLATKPAEVGFAEAATVAVSGLAALQGVRDHGRVEQGQRVLIVGASGGVGSFAVQLAKVRGAHVTGVCSTAKTDLVRALGADDVVDYTTEDVTVSGRRWDVILDIGGCRPLSALRRILTSTGRLVIVGGEGGGRWLGGVDRQLRAMLISPFVRQKLGAFISSENHRDLLVLSDLMASGRLAPPMSTTCALADAPAAIDHVSTGRARGKVALIV